MKQQDNTASVQRDEVLIRRTASGDERAFLELHRRYAPHLTTALSRVLPEEQDVHKAVEDAFVTVWRSAADFDPERTSARAWLMGVVLWPTLKRGNAEKPHCVFLEVLRRRLETRGVRGQT